MVFFCLFVVFIVLFLNTIFIIFVFLGKALQKIRWIRPADGAVAQHSASLLPPVFCDGEVSLSRDWPRPVSHVVCTVFELMWSVKIHLVYLFSCFWGTFLSINYITGPLTLTDDNDVKFMPWHIWRLNYILMMVLRGSPFRSYFILNGTSLWTYLS